MNGGFFAGPAPVAPGVPLGAMGFDSKPGLRGLGGATRKEETREEVLRKAKEERAAREGVRRQARAAALVQAVWRGHLVRRWFRSSLVAEWMEEFGSAAANTSKQLPREEIQSRVLPPLLAAYMPPPFSPRRSAMCSGEPLPLSPVFMAAGNPGTTPLRGGLALTLRSVAASDHAANYTSLAVEGSAQDWHHQARRLVLLCAAVTASEAFGDPLAQSAASRTMMVLTDHQSWRWAAASADHGGQALVARQRLCASLSASPAVFRAAARCVGLSLPPDGGGRPGDPMLHTSLSAALNLLPLKGGAEAQQQRTGMGREDSADQSGAAVAVLRHLLQIPGLIARLHPAAAKSKLSDPWVIQSIITAAARGRLPGMGPRESMCVAGNLAQLVAGPQGTGRPALHESALVANQGPSFVVSYMEAIAAQLRAAVSAGGGGRGLEEAVSSLWPLAERSHVMQLVKVGGSAAMPAFFSTYGALLGGSMSGLLGSAAGKGQRPFLNCLAFAPRLLHHLWLWLARLIGMPLEIPAGTSSGWNIASLRGGAANLPPGQGASLGLFCRLLAHLLLVADDDDFHNHEDPFSVPVSRAVATALNTLVFCTHVPDPSVAKAANSAPPDAMLIEWAPVVLRSLYERDLRRSFCPKNMWLAPYAAVTQDNDEVSMASLLLPFGTRPPPKAANFSAPSVVRALCNLTNDDGHGPPASQVGAVPAGQATGATPSQLAALLLAAPHCVPFAQRVEVFRALIATDQGKEPRRSTMRLRVRRDRLLDDAYEQLGGAGDQLKARLDVTFVNEQGLQEAGLDYGGLMKDFIEDVIKSGFNPGYGLFTTTGGGQYFPGSQAVHMDHGLGLLNFLGLMLGKAMYEGMLMDLPLAPFFILRLQGCRPLFDELQLLDEDIYRSLVALKRYEGDCEVMGLDFSLEHESFGRREVIELIPGGADVPVTNANRLQYVALVADWHLNGGSRGAAATAFARGLSQMVPLSWLNLFSPKELNELIGGGVAGELDVEDMRAHTKYSGGYSETSTTIKLFWNVVAGLSPEHRAALLKFVTSCSRAPLGGFAHLNPPFTIHKVPCSAPLLAALAGPDVDRLPSASTCYNTLKLPNFRRSATMREKLLYAITSNAGFELS